MHWYLFLAIKDCIERKMFALALLEHWPRPSTEPYCQHVEVFVLFFLLMQTLGSNLSFLILG